MKKLNYFLLVFAIAVITASCGKDGGIGPAGPAGAAGPQGAGGVKGDPGTANVIYSDWVTASPWKKDTIFDTYHLHYDIAASKITQAILDNGSVIVYGKLSGYNPSIWPAGTVSALPIVVNYKLSAVGITYTDTWSAKSTVGKIRIDFVNDQNLYGSIANSHVFRYVIIPGGVKTTALAHTNLSNYAEVKQALHLVD